MSGAVSSVHGQVWVSLHFVKAIGTRRVSETQLRLLYPRDERALGVHCALRAVVYMPMASATHSYLIRKYHHAKECKF